MTTVAARVEAEVARACAGLDSLCDQCRPTVAAIFELLWPILEYVAGAQPAQTTTTTPEDTLRAAGISDERQAQYQRRMSSLLAGRPL